MGICIVNVLFENTCEMRFPTYSSQYPSDAQLLWRIGSAQAGMYPSDAWLFMRTWNGAAGVRIPDSYFRSQSVYMRWAVPDSGIPVQLGNSSRCGGLEVCPTPCTCTLLIHVLNMIIL